MKRVWLVAAVILAIGAGAFLLQARSRKAQAELRASREAALAETLQSMRSAIQRYHADKGGYPPSLEQLVPKYLPRIPSDPVTGGIDWRLITEERVEAASDFTSAAGSATEPIVLDIRSTAPGTDQRGKPYSEY